MTFVNIIQFKTRQISGWFINHVIDNAKYVSEKRDSFTNDRFKWTFVVLQEGICLNHKPILVHYHRPELWLKAYILHLTTSEEH